jgi:hypothetical protein
MRDFATSLGQADLQPPSMPFKRAIECQIQAGGLSIVVELDGSYRQLVFENL